MSKAAGICHALELSIVAPVQFGFPVAAVTIPALPNHLPEFQGTHPYIEQEYQFPGALGSLEIRAAKLGISAELCFYPPELGFLLPGRGLQGGEFYLSCNQTGLAKCCQHLSGLSPAPWLPEERGSPCERQRGGQPPPQPGRGHGTVLGCPGAELHPSSTTAGGTQPRRAKPKGCSPGRTLFACVFKPNVAPEIDRGDSSTAWGTILSAFFPGTFKGAEESNSH